MAQYDPSADSSIRYASYLALRMPCRFVVIQRQYHGQLTSKILQGDAKLTGEFSKLAKALATACLGLDKARDATYIRSGRNASSVLRGTL